MVFKTAAESFAFYSAMPTEVLEARSKAIYDEIAKGGDLQALRHELEGIDAALNEVRSESHEQLPTELRSTAASNVEKAEDVFGTPEYRSAFFAKAMGKQLSDEQRAIMTSAAVEKRASEFNSSSNSAAILPTSTLDSIIERARDKGGILSVARRFSIPTGIALPIGGPHTRAQWHVEGTEVDARKLDHTTVAFDGYELMDLISISKKVEVMSISAFETEIVKELGESIAEGLAYTLVHGTGINEGEGIETAITWSEGENLLTTDSFTWRDVLKLVAMLKRGYSRGATFVCNNTTLYEELYGIHTDNDEPLLLRDIRNDGGMRLIGYPIVLDDYLDDGEVLFGNFNYLGFNLPSGIAIERSTESGFRSGTIDFRSMAIADSRVILPEAFTKLVIE